MDTFRKLLILILITFISDNVIAQINPLQSEPLTIRAPAGLTVNQTLSPFDTLLAKPLSPTSSLIEGSTVGKIGASEFELLLQKPFSNPSIATSATAALLGVLPKTPYTFLGALALPYVIDAVTGQVQHQTVSEPTPYPTQSLTTYCFNGWTPVQWCQNSYPTQLGMRASNFNNSGASLTFQCQYPAPNNNLVGSRSCTPTYDNQCSGANTWNSDYSKCRIPCTSPSVYDSATQTCSGSAFNEPANAAQLEQDINDTFNNNPAAALPVLSDLLEHDIVPTSQPTIVSDTMPAPIPGSTKTETQNSFDPVSGHPTTTTKTTETEYQVSKSGPNQVDVIPTTTTTTTTTDNVTNITTTTTNTTVNNPSDTSKGENPPTDCDKYPESIGCSQYGTPATPEIITTTAIPIPTSFTSWGSGTCPADVTVSNHFMTGLTFSYAPVCTFLSSLAPVLIAIGWLISGYMIIGGVRD